MPKFMIRWNPEQYVRIQELLEALPERALKMGPALRQVVTVFLAREQLRFATKESWVPLTPLSAQAKEYRGFPELMVKTGALKASLEGRRGTRPYAVSYNTNTFALMGTSDPVANMLAFGKNEERYQKTTGLRTGKLRPRTLVFIEPDEMLTFFGILETYLVDGVVTTGAAPSVLEGLGI